MFRRLQVGYFVLGVCTLVSCSIVSAEVGDSTVGNTAVSEGRDNKPREPKKRSPRKRKVLSTEGKEGGVSTSPAIVAASEVPVASSSSEVQPLPVLASPQKQEVTPSLPTESLNTPTVLQQVQSTPTVPTPPVSSRVSPPRKFFGIIERLCHPLKDKYFCLSVRWKKANSPDIIAYRIYVGGRCVKEIRSTRKLQLQVLKHTSHSHKTYEVSAVDKNGNESARTPLMLTYPSRHTPLCSCKTEECTPNLLRLSQEELQTLSKERLIEMIQEARQTLSAAQSNGKAATSMKHRTPS